MHQTEYPQDCVHLLPELKPVKLVNVPCRVFQRVSDVPITGEVDPATLDAMRAPRCGNEDPFNKKTLKYRILSETSYLLRQFESLLQVDRKKRKKKMNLYIYNQSTYNQSTINFRSSPLQ